MTAHEQKISELESEVSELSRRVGYLTNTLKEWRGSNLTHALQMSQSKRWETLTLPNNYRSDRSICACAERLLSHNAVWMTKAIVPVAQDRSRFDRGAGA